MKCSFRQLRLGERHELDLDARSLELILGNGRGVSVAIADGCSLWLPLRGELPLDTADGPVVLRPGEMLVLPDGEVTSGLRSRGLWLVLAGSGATWQRFMNQVLAEQERGDTLIYPQMQRCPAELRHLLIGLLRAARRGQQHDAEQELLLAAVMATLKATQRPLDQLAERCAGRTRARRRHNLLRLLRVRQRIRCSPNSRLELANLASAASYSPWHFIRAFRDVFEEAPCEFANRIRLEHARRLIRTGELTVTEVAGLVGYDSRSAFCRSFRHAFGMTATEARQQSRLPRTRPAIRSRSDQDRRVGATAGG